MKRSPLIMFMLLTTNILFAIELWNSFTTTMTREQVSARVLELFENSKTITHEVSGSAYIGYHYGAIPIDDDTLFVTTNNVAYPYLSFYFKDNLLYIISVSWGSDADTLLARHRNQFGNPVDLKTSTVSRNTAIRWYGNNGYYQHTYKDYKWQNSERYIFLVINIYPSDFPQDKIPVKTYFMNRAVYDRWQDEINRKQREKDEDEAKRKKEAIQGITF